MVLRKELEESCESSILRSRGFFMVIQGREYKGIIFDLDGTLYKKKGLGKWFFFPMVRHTHSMIIYKRHRELLMDSDFGTYEELQEAIYSNIENNSRKKRENMAALEDKFHRILMKSLGKRCTGRPGINQVLETLAKHIPLSCISDYQEVPERLDLLHIDKKHFTFMASSPEMGALKPAIRPFLAAADAMGVEPHECLIIGDQEDTDGAAAEKLNMGFLKIGEKAKKGCYVWEQIVEILMKGLEEPHVSRRIS